MFTGIIESTGVVQAIREEGTNLRFTLKSELTSTLHVDQSLAHNGVCLTIVQVYPSTYEVVAVQETLAKSTLSRVQVGDPINLERCMAANGRFDGHIVQGHVDQVGTVESITNQDGSWLISIVYDESLGNVTVEKGSIAIDGISLTCFNSGPGNFSVAIIPYTWEHTNIHTWKVGTRVNLEFDIIGKYVSRLLKRD